MTTRSRFALLPLLALPVLAVPALAADEEAAAKAADLSVSVSKARQLCFPDKLEVTGTLVGRDMVDVSPDREGMRVAQVLVQPLDEVSSGQILARLARMEDQSNATTPIRAPVAGVVVRSNASAGAPVSARLGPLFAILAGGEFDLQADVPLDDLARLAVDQSVTVRPLGQPDVAGKVRRIETSTSPATQLGRVKIGLSPGQDLRLGTFARGIVTVGERCGIGVPYSAISYEAEGTIVHVVNGDRIEARPVETGLLAGDDIEVRSGVTEGDDVVARAGAFVREGDRVNPIPVKDAAEAKGRR